MLVPPVKVSGLESRVMLPFITSDDPETAPKLGTVALLLSATRPETSAFLSVRVIGSCPTTVSNAAGRHFRASTW